MANYTTFTADYPQHIAPSNVELTSITQTQVTTSHSLKRQISSRGGQRFRVRFDYAPMTKDEFATIWAFLMSKKGRLEKFTLALPNQEPRGVATPASSQQFQIKTTQATGSSVVIKNCTTSTTGIFKAGDFFSIAGHGKIYVVTDTSVDSDGSGDATVNFIPELISEATQDDIVTFEPVLQVALLNDELTVALPANRTRNFSVEFIEAVS